MAVEPELSNKYNEPFKNFHSLGISLHYGENARGLRLLSTYAFFIRACTHGKVEIVINFIHRITKCIK